MGHYCKVTTANTHRCVCPDCEYEPHEPVCGYVGNRKSTYKNMCELQRAGCKAEEEIIPIHDGECTGKRLFATMCVHLVVGHFYIR